MMNAPVKIIMLFFPEISWKRNIDHNPATRPGPEFVNGYVIIIPRLELATKKDACAAVRD